MPIVRPVRSAYKPYFFSQQTVFFSRNKSANSTSSHGLSVKRTGQKAFYTVHIKSERADAAQIIRPLNLFSNMPTRLLLKRYYQ